MPKTFADLVELMDRLRAPGGCPWDREQTYATLAPMLLEEAYEAFDALEEARQGRPDSLREELGDLLFQITFFARVAKERGEFTIDDVIDKADIFITATGNFNIVTAAHMAKMKHNAIVGNIGHFDNEIDMAGLKKVPGIKKINIKPQYDEWVFPDGHSVLVLAEGRLLNLGCATGHPSFVMSASFTNQVLAQLELHANAEKIGLNVLMLPKKLDEEVARLHLDHLGVKLTKLTNEQADYIGVPVEGPYKAEHYRY